MENGDMHRRGEEKRILYQLARGIQPIQTRLAWLALFTLNAPETLCHKKGTGSVTGIEAAGALPASHNEGTAQGREEWHCW